MSLFNFNMSKEYTIDASGRTLGRVASEAAALLRGKSEVSFTRHLLPGTAVTIVNADKLKILPQKMVGKKYIRYSGFPGGLRSLNLEQVVKKKGHSGVLREAILRMLPNNKLRPEIIKKLNFK